MTLHSQGRSPNQTNNDFHKTMPTSADGKREVLTASFEEKFNNIKTIIAQDVPHA